MKNSVFDLLEEKMSENKTKTPGFDFDAVFEPDDYLYFYEQNLTPEITECQVQFLIKELKLDKSMQLLDLACGHGRHANRLATLGYNVTGVDNSAGFLKIARKEARKNKLPVRYIKQDMREISFKEKFDRIFMLFTVLGYFSDGENFQVMQKIANALKPGGLVCFDIMNRDAFLSNFLPYIVHERGNNLMIERNEFNSETGELINRRIVIRDGIRKDKPFCLRLYNPTEIKNLLSKAELKFDKIYSSWTGSDFVSTSRRMIIVAKKQYS